MKRHTVIILFFLVTRLLSAQDTLTVMYYNILGFPENDPGRESQMRVICSWVRPDILLVNEISSDAGALILLNQALNVYGAAGYQKAQFTNGPDSDNMLFYNGGRLGLSGQHVIETGLRYINEYLLYWKSTSLEEGGDTTFFYFYSAHLKAGTTNDDEQQRLAEVTLFRQRVDNLPGAMNIFFGGDLNLYSSSEPAYDMLVNQGVHPLHDPLPAGSWHNNSAFAPFHTQSTRTQSFGGGATGGLDDRFDFILFSEDVLNGTHEVSYIPGTEDAFGNDGAHLNKALTDPPLHPVLPDSVIQSLYVMSDHLPVICRLKVSSQGVVPSGDLVITEVMQNPASVNDAAGEWFEVYNPTGSVVNMKGWVIRDDGADDHQVNQDVMVLPDGFAVMGISNDPGLNGGYICDYQYQNFFLGNNDDEIVLLRPDGAESDRITYDGGTSWPDPTGASMVYTGPSNGDNNQPGLWVTADYREPTFFGSSGDRGSPGTNGAQQQLAPWGIWVDLKVILEGPYNSGSMQSGLSAFIPLSQPYQGAPWLYEGDEAVSQVPAGVVDWILVELRDAPDVTQAGNVSQVARQAAFVMDNGAVCSLNAADLPFFPGLTFNHLPFAVIWHRNHLPVMSQQPMNDMGGGVIQYDFSTGSGQVVGGTLGCSYLEAGTWGMSSGDGDASGLINNTDKNEVWSVQAGTGGYLSGDFNMDAQVNNGDKNEHWLPNAGKGSQVIP
ncbi:MAG: lamin tail domain-containing protein [Bacteroidales bacterium]|nr:lamin tail domain-containing protein [Bacteroidales bacterium]